MRGIMARALMVMAGVWGSGVMAGPLAPPAGPIGSTYRTLSEVEPRVPVNATTAPGTATAVHRITASGSYYLTGDVVVPSGKSGIILAAPNITLDMRGFTIRGEAGSVNGIGDETDAANSHVYDGSFVGLGSTGLFGNTASGSVYRNLTARGCGQRGLQFASASTATHCTANENAQGIVASLGATLSECSAALNSGIGFLMSDGSVVSGCTAINNGGNGFQVNARVRMVDCVARSNSGDGFSASSGSEIAECLAVSNSGNGFVINVTSGSDFNSVIRRSTAVQNVAAGIRAGGGRALIDENVCRQNGTGILVQSGAVASLVIRNVAGGNTTSNYNIGTGHRVGAIVLAPTSGAINGNSGGGLGTVDPWANFAE